MELLLQQVDMALLRHQGAMEQRRRRAADTGQVPKRHQAGMGRLRQQGGMGRLQLADTANNVLVNDE